MPSSWSGKFHWLIQQPEKHKSGLWEFVLSWDLRLEAIGKSHEANPEANHGLKEGLRQPV